MSSTALSILLVEPDPEDARLITSALRASSLTVGDIDRVGDVRAAVGRLERGRFDLILLDLGTPGADWDESVRRTREPAPRVPLLVLTPSADVETAVRVVGLGVEECMWKEEIDETRLSCHILQAMERRRRENEHEMVREQERAARAEAERAIRDRDELLGIVAHDLRDPLSAIAMYSSLLQDEGSSPVQRQRYLDALNRSTARMDRLIGDLLELSRIESGTLRVRAEPLLPEMLLSETVDLHETGARSRGVSLTYELEGDLPPVLVDRDRMAQVFSNLISNAVRFTPTGGQVVLRAEPAGESIRFSVSDSGSGMSEEDLPHAFNRFWQAQGSRSGAGLGLTIVKGIVEAHGGAVEIESEVGQGTTVSFTVPLPVVDAPAGTDVTGSVAQPGMEGAAGKPMRPIQPVKIVLVDDHPAIRRGLADVLSARAELNVVGEAASGEEAIERVRQLDPDVVVMDLVMPGMGGIQAMTKILREKPSVRILALTGDPEEETLLPVLEAGACGFVRKTTAHKDLLPAIQTVRKGGVFLYPSGQRLLLRAYRDTSREEGKDPLRGISHQEREILRLVAEGYTSREIGKKLYLSPSTVDTYRSQILKTLGLSHRTEVIRLALQTGLLTADEPGASGSTRARTKH